MGASMASGLKQKMVIGVSSRALFDLNMENEIFEKDGVEAYCRYQTEHEEDILKPGPGFRLIKALLALNEYGRKEERVEVIIMSRNSPDTSLRVFHSIQYYGLHITRAALVSGASLAPYLMAFHTDLFLSACEEDVQYAIDCGIAAGIICTGQSALQGDKISLRPGQYEQIRFAFDGDAVLFTDESECIFRNEGLLAFEENEKVNASNPMNAGPFAGFLRKLSDLQKEFGTVEAPIRTALVTARCAPAHERVLRTLRAWDVRIDEAFFMGGIPKKEILKAFDAHIFFDDQAVHTQNAAQVVPAARVPYKRTETRKRDLRYDEIQTYRTG